ncbi:MAG TPA: hypothetical protein PLZ43_13430 [bacterium]|nr:hypothetical protein [bacterium]
MDSQFFDKLKKLNTGRVGSFGEYIFEQQCRSKGIDVKRYFRERTDFLVGTNLERVDVKTTLKHINKSFDNVFGNYGGTKLTGINYVCVNFYTDTVVFSCEGRPYFQELNSLKLTEAEDLFLKWRSKRKNEKNIEKDMELEQQSKNAVQDMRSRIEKFFDNTDYSVKIIYRTCQRIFGTESPGNLLPYVKNELKPQKKQIKIFVDYNDPVIADDNVFQVFAFPEEKYKELPLLNTVHVKGGKEQNKVDLDKIAAKFVFLSIADLMSDNYKKMFK